MLTFAGIFRLSKPFQVFIKLAMVEEFMRCDSAMFDAATSDKMLFVQLPGCKRFSPFVRSLPAE